LHDNGTLVDRFKALVGLEAKREVVEQEDELEDHIAEQLEMVREIGKRKEYTDGLKPLLLERLRGLDGLIPGAISSHPKLAELEGRKFEIRGLMEWFEKDSEEM